jgi:MFS family permease
MLAFDVVADSLEIATRRATLTAETVGAATVRTVRPTVTSAMGLVSDRLGFVGVSDSKEASWLVLGHKQFRHYFAGSLVSNAGTWLQNTAQMLLAYQLRHSVFTVGLVTCAQFSSPLLLGPSAGVVADRFGSRRTLLSTQIASTVITAILAILEFTHSLGEGSLLAGAFMTGFMFTFALPAQSVMISSLVKSAGETKSAMAMNSVSYNAGRALAPALGVLIVTTIGFAWAFTLHAISFGIFTIVLLRVRPYAALPAPIRSKVRDGFRVAWDERKIVLLLVMVAMVTFADDPVLVLGPALAHHVGKSDDWSGYFLAALGVGSVLGALLPRRKSQSARRAATALAFLGISMMVFATASWAWVSIAAAFAAGVAGLVAGSAAQAMLVGLAGPERALRVMGLWTVAWAGSKPIASIIDGTLPSLVGVRVTGVILASPTLLPLIILIFCPALVQRAVRPRGLGSTDTGELVHIDATDAPAVA